MAYRPPEAAPGPGVLPAFLRGDGVVVHAEGVAEGVLARGRRIPGAVGLIVRGVGFHVQHLAGRAEVREVRAPRAKEKVPFGSFGLKLVPPSRPPFHPKTNWRAFFHVPSCLNSPNTLESPHLGELEAPHDLLLLGMRRHRHAHVAIEAAVQPEEAAAATRQAVWKAKERKRRNCPFLLVTSLEDKPFLGGAGGISL